MVTAARTCSCGTALGPRNTSGVCRPCVARRLNSDSEITARRLAGIRASAADPEVRAAKRERMKRVVANLTPEQIERRRQHGKRQVRDVLSRPEVKALSRSPEVRAKAGRARSATVLAWCPEEWRDTYRELKRKGRTAAVAKALVLDLIAGGQVILYAQQKAKLAWCPADRLDEYRRLQKSYSAAEARRMIEEDIATAEKRRRDAMTPLDHQLERLRNGGVLVEKPVVRRAEHDFSLVGCATGLL